MDANNLHKIAMEYAEKVWQERSDYVSTYYSTITVLISDGGHIYTGITGLAVNYGDVEILRSEKGATAAMLLDGQTYAKQMVTLSFKTRKFAEPNEDALRALYELDHRNALCQIMVADDNITTIGDILGVEYDPAEEEAAAAAEEAPAPEPAEEAEEEVIEEAVEEEVAEIEEEEAAEYEEDEAEEAEDESEDEDEAEEEDSDEEYESDEEADEEDSEEEYESDEEAEEEDSEDEYEEGEEEEEDEDDDESDKEADPDAQPDFLVGFDFGDDTGPTSEIVVPKVQKSYEEYDKKNEERRAEKSFSDGVEIDESNPFFDAGNSEQREVVAFANMETVKQEIEEGPKQPAMSKKEMLKLAKKRKKIAKNNNRYR